MRAHGVAEACAAEEARAATEAFAAEAARGRERARRARKNPLACVRVVERALDVPARPRCGVFRGLAKKVLLGVVSVPSVREPESLP